MPGELSDLIARLEGASEGSRELDALICATMKLCPADAPDWVKTWSGPFRTRDDGRVQAMHSDGRGGVHWMPPPYTTSLDAALTLMPEHALWAVGQQEDVFARVVPAISGGWLGSREQTSFAKTPALALVIAALKARARAPVPPEGAGE